MKIGKSYTIDEEIIDKMDKESKKRGVSVSWLVNDFLKEKLKEVDGNDN